MTADSFTLTRHQVDGLPIRDVFNLSQALLLALNHVGDATCDQLIHLAYCWNPVFWGVTAPMWKHCR